MRVTLNITVSKIQIPDIAGQTSPAVEGLSIRSVCVMDQKELQTYARTIAAALNTMTMTLQAKACNDA